MYLGGMTAVNPERAAVIAGVLAHVKENDPSAPFAVQMARAPEGTGNARVSGLRFRRLLQVPDSAGLFEPGIRTVALLGGRANIDDLGRSILWWNEKTKKTWAFQYYANAPSDTE
jgi:CRISPR system Cascade subunit CasB